MDRGLGGYYEISHKHTRWDEQEFEIAFCDYLADKTACGHKSDVCTGEKEYKSKIGVDKSDADPYNTVCMITACYKLKHDKHGNDGQKCDKHFLEIMGRCLEKQHKCVLGGKHIGLKISTERIGPMLQRETRPKLSLEFFVLFIEARPAPSAIINGTVIGPVVTPPESNAVGTKSSGAKKARTIMKA